jgi:iron complex outermembrane receptor protein
LGEFACVRIHYRGAVVTSSCVHIAAYLPAHAFSHRLNNAQRGELPMYHRRFSTASFMAAAFLLLFFPHFASAQTEAASIRGSVKDQQGAVVREAKVTATRIETGTVASTTTNADGNYFFTGLMPGHFRISVTKQGFKGVSTRDFTLGIQATAEQNLTLLVGSATETIQVTTAPDSFVALDSSSATRTDTPLIEVPQSVETITHAVLVEQDAHTLADALVNVSGVVPTKPEESLFTSPIVRGFPAEIYSDGLAMFGNTTTADDPASNVGVERIEVAKGPNSTMYGGGVGSPLGGLINLVSERPEPRQSGYVAFRTGAFTTLDPYGDLNIPINAHIASRLAGEYQKNDSWVDLVDGDRWALQPSTSIQLGSKTDLFVQGKFNHRNQLEYSGIPADQALAGLIDRNAFSGAPVGQPHTTLDSRMATVELNHAFTNTLRWNTSLRYYFSQAAEYGSFVYPGLNPPDPAPPVYQVFTLDMPSNPAREGSFDTNLAPNLRGLGGRHELLAGVSYDHTNFYSGMGFSGVPVGNEDLSHPTYNLSFGPLTPVTLTQADRYQTTAVYGQDQATYGRLHLTGSIRYTQLDFREREQATDETYHHVSGRAGGTFDVVQGVALYAAYATAFRGSFGFIGLQAPKPETSQNVEGGLKLALTRAHLAGTVAIFNQTRDNVATPDPTNFLYSVQTGQQRARGAETDLTWEPLRAFSLLANYAYTQATVTQDNSTPVGNFLQRVPRNSGRVAGRCAPSMGALLRV